MKKDHYRIYAIAAYFLSLVTPVFWGEWESLGIIILYYGLTGILLEPHFLLILPWLANWIFLINVALNKKSVKLSIVVSILTIMLSLFTLAFPMLHMEKNVNETFLGFGFFFWLLSFVLLLMGQIMELKTSKTNQAFEVKS